MRKIDILLYKIQRIKDYMKRVYALKIKDYIEEKIIARNTQSKNMRL